MRFMTPKASSRKLDPSSPLSPKSTKKTNYINKEVVRKTLNFFDAQYQKEQKKAVSTAYKSWLTVNYSTTLSEMTKSLVVYDEIIREKRREKEDILSEITELKREVKRLNTEVKKYKYRSESLHQEERKIKHTSSRKSKERFFITKEIADINSDIPTLFHHIQAMNDLKEKL